jgi:hypothetical protein
MNERQVKTGWMLNGLLALFGLTYALGAIYFFLGWLGWQSLPSAWQRTSNPFLRLYIGSRSSQRRWRIWLEAVGCLWADPHLGGDYCLERTVPQTDQSALSACGHAFGDPLGPANPTSLVGVQVSSRDPRPLLDQSRLMIADKYG